MDPSTPLSTTARRNGDSPISDLMARALAAPDLISLAAGFVDHATLPVKAAAAAAAAVLTDEVEGHRALQYGTTKGDPKLRHRLVEQVERSEGVEPGRYASIFDRTVVTTGSQQLLYLVAEALIDPGDIVLVEAPTYFVFMGVLQARGARIIGVETDEQGLNVEALEATLREIEARGELGRVKLIYTVSEHSNPTGLSLAPSRRPELVRVAKAFSKRNRIYILEDAAYRGLTFEGPEANSVWSHDADSSTVILARTFSKTFSPGIKLGYGVLPADLVDPILGLKGNHDFGSSNLNQILLEHVLSGDAYGEQVELLAATYRRKRDVMLGALEEHLAPFKGEVSWTRPKGGLYVWLTLPEGIDTGRSGRFFDRCVAEGVLYVPGEYAYPSLPGPVPINQARLTYGVTAEPGLVEGIRRLAVALGKTLADGASSPGRRQGSTVVTA